MEDVRERMQNVKIPTAEEVKDSVVKTTNAVLEGAENIKTNVTNSLREFSSQNAVNASKEYLDSNSMIAKVAFIILGVIIFLVVIYLGVRLVIYLFAPSQNPYLIKGVLSGNSGIIISQDPQDSNSIYIYKSNDQPSGLEFTWSYWLNVNSLDTQYNRVFIKGQDTQQKNDNPQSSSDYKFPGVYLHTESSQPLMRINLFPVDNSNINIDISNIPMNKWFHTAIRMQNTVMDVYVNGTIANRTLLSNIPRQNSYPVLIGGNGGFSGQISNLRYYSYALSTFELNNIVLGGPSLSPNQLSGDAQGKYLDYISSAWYNKNL